MIRRLNACLLSPNRVLNRCVDSLQSHSPSVSRASWLFFPLKSLHHIHTPRCLRTKPLTHEPWRHKNLKTIALGFCGVLGHTYITEHQDTLRYDFAEVLLYILRCRINYKFGCAELAEHRRTRTNSETQVLAFQGRFFNLLGTRTHLGDTLLTMFLISVLKV